MSFLPEIIMGKAAHMILQNGIIVYTEGVDIIYGSCNPECESLMTNGRNYQCVLYGVPLDKERRGTSKLPVPCYDCLMNGFSDMITE
jgi:hypothetical protein